MAVSGFEGFEKRLELHFSGDDRKNVGSSFGLGLRRLDFESLQHVLHAVQCTVVSAVANHYFDAYVLSESSLFVYPTKIIIKTCGTTQLLKSIPPLLRHASLDLGLTLVFCRYTRGNFIFPNAQPFPYTNFQNEVVYLEESLPDTLCYRKANVMPSKTPSHAWHVFSASTENTTCPFGEDDSDGGLFTLEICMTELDRDLARNFFLRPGTKYDGDSAGKEMTARTGISGINPRALICDFAFDPCGYSMNGIYGNRHSTIHVTPEDGYSYASFECVGSVYDDRDDVVRVLKKVVQIFRPATMSVSTTCASHEVWTRVAGALEPLGLKCRSCSVDEFPASGNVVYQTFVDCRSKKNNMKVGLNRN